MYKCYNCKTTFEEPKITNFEGAKYAFCPHCNGDFDEAEICKECGNCFFKEDMAGDFCKECLKGFSKDYKKIKLVAENDLSDFKLPRLFKIIFSNEELKNILYRFIEDNHIDCSGYINEDIDFFGETLSEVIK